ncbi:PucR family transcriptional regulator [Leucobacter sp. W1153]|uniref:PucR family transcriptional regulator n=1 Tax=Leucobacter sp. W1153 TaxID=3439064 RepID=UPI003F3802CE
MRDVDECRPHLTVDPLDLRLQPLTQLLVERAQALFSSEHIPAIATIKDAHLLLLTGADAAADQALIGLSEAVGRVGVSAGFSELEGLAGAARQAQIALSRTTQSGEAEVVRFDTGTAPSLFLPSETSQLRALAEQVLGTLQAYDQHRGTPLVHTLQVFLEENRSWVRAAERLFIHRQTLVARIARIESITGRDLNSMEDAAECWLAVRAAVECGELPAS